MEMNKKVFIGLLGVFLAFSLLSIGCKNSSGGDGGASDPTVNPIEAAFTNMLKENFFVSGSNVTVVNAIRQMSNWGQTNSEYEIRSSPGNNIMYSLPPSFGTTTVISGGSYIITGGGAYVMTGPNAGIIWGTPTGNTGLIVISGNDMRVISGSDGSITYPYTVSFPSGSNAQVIKGNLNLKRGVQ
jgi:hypothetical protein